MTSACSTAREALDACVQRQGEKNAAECKPLVRDILSCYRFVHYCKDDCEEPHSLSRVGGTRFVLVFLDV